MDLMRNCTDCGHRHNKNKCPRCGYIEPSRSPVDCDAAFDAMYEACLNAVRAYEALDLLGSSLPGLAHCKERLHNAIEMAAKAKVA